MPAPRTLPFTLQVEQVREPNTQAFDLDGDGRDELVNRYKGDGGFGSLTSYILMTEAWAVIDQVNVNGDGLAPLARDLDGDRIKEIVIPVVRNDSLFVTVVGRDGRKRYGVFLTTGRPRQDPDGSLPWDPGILDIYAVDVDGDGRLEMVTVLVTGFARLPRGVLVHSLPEGEPLGSAIVGAAPYGSVLDDFDGDGHPEVLVATGAIKTMARAGGFDDENAYLIGFELFPRVGVSWHREFGSAGQIASAHYVDADGDGRRELVVTAAVFSGRAPGETRFEILEPGTWRTIRSRSRNEAFFSPVVVDLRGDARPEIVVGHHPDEVWILNADFDVVERRRVAPAIRTLDILPDLDGDGVEELLVVLGPRWGFLLLDPDLEIKARFEGAGRPGSTLRPGTGRSLLLVGHPDRTEALSLQPNRWFWAYRAAPVALGAGAPLGLIALGLLYRRRRYRGKLRRAVHAVEVDHGPAGILVLDAAARPRWVNATLRSRIGAENGTPGTIDELADRAPEVARFIRERFAVPAPERAVSERTVTLADGARVRLRLLPLRTGTRRDLHWVLRVEDDDGTWDPAEERAWALMAQRVAHGLRNPLTSILLTLQRLQMEYRERAPAVANRLDRYAQRIGGRVDELRQLTSNFLKYVDLEEPERRPVDVSALVQEFGENARRSLPPDIRLELRLQPDLPSVRADRAQLRDVLDNLVSNAVNAMPDGGVVTISTTLARQVGLSGRVEPVEVVQLEVLDTGTGITEETLARIFEPGFSGDPHGTGIGLAIVRKIADDHGGVVSVESEPGTGSAFCVSLPVGDEAAGGPTSRAEPAARSTETASAGGGPGDGSDAAARDGAGAPSDRRSRGDAS